MIMDAILDVVFGALNALVALLPNNTLNLDGLNEGAQYLGWVGLFIDVPAFAAVVSIIASVEAGLLAIRAALFIWRLTPLSG
jgi:hypothetical protein